MRDIALAVVMTTAGDLVATPDTIPAIVNYGDGGSWTDLGRALDEVAALDFDTLIGGHGPALSRADFLPRATSSACCRSSGNECEDQ